MPLNCCSCDCSPLLIDNEIIINDEPKLVEYVGHIILGYYRHVQNIIDSKSGNAPTLPDDIIDEAINTLSSTTPIKRDGWIFQIISWIALYKENIGKAFYCQQPHDAPAQHGIDGLAVILSSSNEIEKVIITEDKCTEDPRNLINNQIWPEFSNYEIGSYDNKLVSRVSAMLANVNKTGVLESIYKDAFRKEIRIYRVGINRDNRYKDSDGRKKLFKDYDNCVKGNLDRRSGATLYKEDIRDWMSNISNSVIDFLKSKKSKSV